ncbi:MAG: hypothetical protein AAFU03_15885 [Bacteroidota bacterium]
MKQFFFLLVLFVSANCLFAETEEIIFVTVDGQSDQLGTSWNEPTSLHAACQRAEAGDKIWIAAGVYFPGQDRESYLQLQSGVEVYGGFAGFESDLNQRSIQQNVTVLSGDIGVANEAKDNSYTIMYLAGVDKGTIIDGLVFRAGAAKGYSEDRTPHTAGAAIYIDGGQGPTVRNCTFDGNVARYGGAVYVNGLNSNSGPTFNNCMFVNNGADFKGGAIYNSGENGVANTVLQGCQFVGNSSDYGAAILNNGTSGESSPLILNCQFMKNYSISAGAVVYNLIKGTNGKAEPVINNCELLENGSILGNDVARHQNPTAHVQPTTTPNQR